MTHHAQHNIARTLVLVAFVILASAPVFAGGPLEVCSDGQPYLWPNGGVNIPFNPDQGDLGPLTNAQAVALVQFAFDQWGNVPTSTVTYANAGLLPVDVDISNFFPYLFPSAPDGFSAIVFDDTGAIFDLLFGAGSGVLGFAGPEWINPVSCDILEGVSFLNGPAFGAQQEALDVMVHEFGHYTNLAHTVVNGQIVLGDTSGPTPFNTFPVSTLVNTIETMYPFYFGPAAGTSTPHADDVAILSTLYPEPAFSSTTGSIAGTIYGPNGTTRVSGVNIIARNVADPFVDAVSAISSDFTDSFSQSNPWTGIYSINGLTPGAEYAVFVDEILAGGFSTPPESPLPGPEEFYNGGNESNGAVVADEPDEYVVVAAAAGATQAGVDVVFNTPRPGDPLPVGDDGNVTLYLPFPFEVCGERFDSVFVNANGNLTFGGGSSTYTESSSGMLSGLPRIAGVWDDLNPSAGGIVTFDTTPEAFSVIWQDVPEYPSSGANSFEITLFADKGRDPDDDDDDDDDGDDDDDEGKQGNRFAISIGSLTLSDGLTGYSCGGAITSAFETETDLSAARTPLKTNGLAAVYEEFVLSAGEANDLAGRDLEFRGIDRFADRYEPNNTLRRATRVRAPFDTVTKFSDIRPAGDDIDFFSFSAKAGDIFAVEVVRGDLDSLIGVFDAKTGDLLLADDDGGSGLRSRLLFTVSENLKLAVGVTTYPDYGFVGAGGSGGRFVLAINRYRGEILPAGDDSFTAVELTDFSFDFQGQRWDTVYVNDNGNLTFGEGDTDYSESVTEFLAGPPRIAALWDDLTPAGNFFTNPGLVIADRKEESLTIHYVSVSEFFSSSPNYFSITLDDEGEVKVEHGATARSDALVGVTEGGGASDPGESDLSTRNEWSASGTTYELFPFFPSSTSGFSDFDLFFDRLRFEEGDDDD